MHVTKATVTAVDLHPDLRQLEILIGTWRGTGHGSYPTIDDFDYTEEVLFIPGPGKPFVSYVQKTADVNTGEPLHSELGYLRAVGPGRVEMVIAQPTGVVEVHTGSIDGQHLHLRSGIVDTTPTAKEVTEVERHFEIDGHTLRYRLGMAAIGHELTTHLTAELQRIS